MIVTGHNFHAVYNGLLQGLIANGESATPRGRKVLEMPDPTIWTVASASNWVPNMKGRRLNIFFALAEVVWMWSGNGSVDFISFYNNSIKQFQDGDLPYFHGSYGKRVRHYGYEEDFTSRPEMPWTTRHIQAPDGTYGVYAGQESVEIDQLKSVIRKLQLDPYTRQAVVSLWDPFKDNLIEGSLDYPCNNLVYSQIRDTQRAPQLKTTVVMRSNDLILGTPYNMIQFAHLHALLAGSLGVEMGSYSVVANNLHMYETAYYPEAVQKLVARWKTGSASRPGIYGNSCLFPMGEKLTWDMRWTIPQFDTFIPVWVELEKSLRIAATNGNLDTCIFQENWELLAAAFEDQAVPIYWRELFTLLMVWHARRDKFDGWSDWTSALLETVNPTFRALALDFDPTLA